MFWWRSIRNPFPYFTPIFLPRHCNANGIIQTSGWSFLLSERFLLVTNISIASFRALLQKTVAYMKKTFCLRFLHETLLQARPHCFKQTTASINCFRLCFTSFRGRFRDCLEWDKCSAVNVWWILSCLKWYRNDLSCDYNCDSTTIRRYHDAFDYVGSGRNYDLRSIRLRYDTTRTKNWHVHFCSCSRMRRGIVVS